MCGGNKTQTQSTTQNQTTGPQPQFANLLAQQGTNTAALGSTNPASLVAPVAGFAAPQTQGFNTALMQAGQGLQGLATPYINDASNSLGNAGPVTSQGILDQFSPFINAQLGTTANAFNLINQQQAQGEQSRAAQLGALTGDRSQMAQNLLAQNQATAEAPVLANIAQGGYGQALNAALANQQAALNQGAQYGNLANTAQNTGFGNVNQLLGIGGQQQGQSQAQLNYGAQVAGAPLNLQQYLNSEIARLSGAAGSTSTGTGTVTTPGPSGAGQIAGLGLGLTGLAGSFFDPNKKTTASGGRIKGYDKGGGVAPLDAWSEFSPQPIAPLQARPMPSLAQASGPQGGQQGSGGASGGMPSAQSFASAGQGLGNLWSALNTTTGPASISGSGVEIPGFSTTVSPTMAGMGNYLDSALGGGLSSLGSAFTGGMDALGSMGAGIAGMGADALGGLGAGVAGMGADLSALLPFLLLKSGGRVKGYATDGSVDDDGTLTPQDRAITAPTPGVTDSEPSSIAMAQDPRMNAGLGDLSPSSAPASGGQNGLAGINPWLALAAAGFGMAASPSHFVGQAVGQGGLAGMQNLEQQQQQRMQQARLNLAQAQEAMQQKNIKSEIAQREQGMAQSAATAPGALELQKEQIAKAKQDVQAGKVIPIDMGLDPVTYQPKKGLYNYAEGTVTSFNPDGTVTTRPVSEAAAPSPGAAGTPPTTPAGLPTATGPNGEQLPLNDYLKQIQDPGMRGKVGAVLRGEDTLANISARNPMYGQMVQRLVYGFDPMFSPVIAQSRVETDKSLANHKAGYLGNYSDSIGKMADHLNLVTDAAKDLQTTPVLQWNRATQAFETQTGDPRQVKFAAAANVYMHELAKVLKGGTGAAPTDQDMQALAAYFSAPMSPDQLRGVINTWDHAARAAFQSTDATTQRTMGPVYNADRHSVVTPYAQKKLDALDNNTWLHPEKAQPKYVAKNSQNHTIYSDDGKNWRETP